MIEVKAKDKCKDLCESENERLLREYANSYNIEVKNVLINHNLGLIDFSLRKIGVDKSNLYYGDLYNEGVTALIKAIDNFDMEKDIKFSTYAVKSICSNINRYYRKNRNLVNLSYNKIELYNKYLRYIKRYEETYQKYPSLKEVCLALNTSENEIKDILNAMYYQNIPIYLDSDLVDEDDIKMTEKVGLDDFKYSIINSEIDNKILFYKLKKFLSSYDYYIIYHMIINDNLDKVKLIASVLGTSANNIYSLYHKILKKIKDSNILDKDMALDVKKIMNFDTEPINFHDKVILIYLEDYLEPLEYDYLYKVYYMKKSKKEFMREYNIIILEFNELERKMRESYISLFNAKGEEYLNMLNYVKTKLSAHKNIKKIFNFDLKYKFNTYMSNKIPKY